MALSQKGVHYDGRNELDLIVRRAIDDVASKVSAVAKQVQATASGVTPTPHPPTALSVSAANGFATLNITHNSPPKGAAYVIEYATTPNFENPVTIDNGISRSWQQYLKGQTLYFRTASTVYTSPQSGWTYYGTETTPTAVTF
jgi:hypothetical protein